MIKLIWTKHAVKRGYQRLGRYGMDTLESKILANMGKAKEDRSRSHERPDRKKGFVVPFKLGRKRCVALVTVDSNDRNTVIIKTIYAITQENHQSIFSQKIK